jgi:hypothetical protein
MHFTSVYLRAFVTQVYTSSIEVYSMAIARTYLFTKTSSFFKSNDFIENRTDSGDKKFVSEAFFTLAAIDPTTSIPVTINSDKESLKKVKLPGEIDLGTRGKKDLVAARKIWEGAGKRREERLLEKQLLETVYA